MSGSGLRTRELDLNHTICRYGVVGHATVLSLSGKVKLESLQRLVPLGVEAIDDATKWLDREDPESNTPILLCDMSNVRYVELPVLFYINAVVASHRASHRVLLRLPTEPDVIRFLVRWNYVKAFIDAAGSTSEHEVLRSGAEVYRESVNALATLAEQRVTPDGQRVTLLPQQYYEIKSFPHTTALTSAFSSDIARAWNEQHVVDVLRRLMGPERGKWVPHTILKPMLDNALMHPQATVIQHGAQHEGRLRHSLPLKIVLWDNGVSIVDTLREAMVSGDVVAPTFDLTDITIQVRVISRENGANVRVVEHILRQKELSPLPDDPDWFVLIAALMPGVSRRDPHDFEASAGIGLGLHQIASSVTHRYGGTLVIWTKDLYLCIRSAPSPYAYSVEVRVPESVDGDEHPEFAGNLLSVSLPDRAHGDSR